MLGGSPLVREVERKVLGELESIEVHTEPSQCPIKLPCPFTPTAQTSVREVPDVSPK
jgi:hypothetical protein